MTLTQKLTTAKSELESYLDSVRGGKLEQDQIDRLLTLNGLLGIGAVSSGGGGTQTIVLAIFRATAAGTGYSTNDIIILRQTPPAPAEYYNATTGATIATPSSTNLGSVSTASNVSIVGALPTGANTIGAVSNTAFIATQGNAANLNATVVFSSPQAVTQSGSWAVGVTGSVAITGTLPAFTTTPTVNIGTSTLALESTGNLAGINNKLPSSLGAKTAVNSLSVAPATDAIFAIASETGFLNFRNQTLSNTPSQIKATAGQTRGWNLINPNTVAVYVKLYDALAANVVVGTTAVVRTLAIPAGGVFFLEAQSVSQDDFLTAISIACVTGLLDNSTTAPTTPIHAGVRYK